MCEENGAGFPFAMLEIEDNRAVPTFGRCRVPEFPTSLHVYLHLLLRPTPSHFSNARVT